MIRIEDHLSKTTRGCFDGHFLVAMPGMSDNRFARSVIFVCAHSGDGAMGFVLNKSQAVTFADIVGQLDLAANKLRPALDLHVLDFPIQSGGPVDPGRGFVLHSDDYMSASTMPINDDLCMTATVDIVRAIRDGQGPKRATMMLGYAGWGAGQLEDEIAANTWLTCPACDDLVFDRRLDGKYDRVLTSMGVSAAMLSVEAGHA